MHPALLLSEWRMESRPKNERGQRRTRARVGRPATLWQHLLLRFVGAAWKDIAQDRGAWTQMRPVFQAQAWSELRRAPSAPALVDRVPVARL